MLADCLPNVVDLQDFYYQFTDTILIKTSPILDLHAGLLELKMYQKFTLLLWIMK